MTFLGKYGYTPDTLTMESYYSLQGTGGFFPPIEEVRPCFEKAGAVFGETSVTSLPTIELPHGATYWILDGLVIPSIVSCTDENCKYKCIEEE